MVAVIPCARLDGFHIPGLACKADAYILDGLENPADFEAIRRWVQLAWNKPVLVRSKPSPKSAPRSARPRPSGPPPNTALKQLADSFLRFADQAAIRDLSTSRPFPVAEASRDTAVRRTRFRVAYAMDEAFGAYFPDTLEAPRIPRRRPRRLLPPRDENLPAGVDLVMIGCGYPDRFASDLAKNDSLLAALKHHVCRGRRLYAEGGGAAYLGRFLHVDGRVVQGAGILPFDAVFNPDAGDPVPVSQFLTRESWLGAQGVEVRGYRSTRWVLSPAPDPTDCPARAGTLTTGRDIYFRHRAIGSLIHIHPAALPEPAFTFASDYHNVASQSSHPRSRNDVLPRPPFLA